MKFYRAQVRRLRLFHAPLPLPLPAEGAGGTLRNESAINKLTMGWESKK